MLLNIWKLNADNTFTQLAIIDYATSIIWVEPFQDVGNFELYLRATPELIQMFINNDIFITKNDSVRGMYVETIQLTEDIENGNYLTISGHSAEIMLMWRVIPRINFTGANTTAEDIIRSCVTEPNYGLVYSDTSYLPSNNQIPFVSIETAHGWDDKTTRQFTGKTLFAIVQDICKTYNYGFRFAWTGSGFEFQLYKGTDRSFDQSTNSYVVFSPDFNNLSNSEYIKDSSDYYNCAIIGGQGEGVDRIFASIYGENKIGFARRILWVDARQTSRNTESGELSYLQYMKLLQAQGNDAISDHKETESFSGEIFTNISYRYGEDYFIGDKVAVKNSYGIIGNATVIEITEVEDSEGYRIVPTLSEWEIINTEEE